METKNLIMSLVAFCVLGLSSCSENDSPAFSSNVLKNTELRNILTSKGFSFDKEGKLELNELATSTVSLDLSSTKLTDLSGLDILPNLKEVKLSNNGYGPTFDFSALPSQITSVDLTGNNIYDFEGLVDVKIENEEPKTTILRDFKKLYLPTTAKYNVEDLMPYYLLKGQEADMQMADAAGKMQKYNTIREIPDATFNSYVKTLYPSMYVDGNHIDMAKVPTLADQGHSFLYQPDEEEAPESLEGIEYFVNNPYLKDFYVALILEKPYSVGRLMPRSNITGLVIGKTEIAGGVDLSKATKLGFLILSNCSSITALDLSHTKICNQEIKDFNPFVSSRLQISHCPNLESITFPKPATNCLPSLLLGDLPKLKKVDLSMIEAAEEIHLFLDNTAVVYPKLKKHYNTSSKVLSDLATSEEQVAFSVSKKMLETPALKAFVKAYGQYCRDDSEMFSEEFGAAAWKENNESE